MVKINHIYNKYLFVSQINLVHCRVIRTNMINTRPISVCFVLYGLSSLLRAWMRLVVHHWSVLTAVGYFCYSVYAVNKSFFGEPGIIFALYCFIHCPHSLLVLCWVLFIVFVDSAFLDASRFCPRMIFYGSTPFGNVSSKTGVRIKGTIESILF